ncbi:MAG: AraC family transcriptional regulator [Planctomycetota bacterium]
METPASRIARYAHGPPLPSEAVRLEVLGLDRATPGLYATPRGIPAVRVTQFHDPVTVDLDGKRLTLPAETAIAFPADAPVRYGRTDGEAWRHSWVRLGGDGVEALLARCGVRPGAPVAMGDAEAAARWLSALDEEMHHPAGPDPATLEALLTVWLRAIGRRAGGTAPSVPEPFRRARQYIETHFLEPLTLEEIAAHAHRSARHLCEGFRRHYGAPPIAYAIRLRLDHAGERLRETDEPVGEVARHCGFRDIYYFSRLFRKHKGCPPTDWRRRNAS